MSRRARKFSKAHSTIQAALEIAQEHARIIESILNSKDDIPQPTTDRELTSTESSAVSR